MSDKLALGPLLSVEDDNKYVICFLSKNDSDFSIFIDKEEIKAEKIGILKSGNFYRAEFEIKQSKKSKTITYNILNNNTNSNTTDAFNRDSWSFYVPSSTEKPKFAYASCNGFSSPDLLAKTDEPYLLWDKLIEQHGNEPFSILIMGGDQVYADELWSKVKELEEWSRLNMNDKIKRKATKAMIRNLDTFYESLYIKKWSDEQMSLCLASIPTVMMWDDHDIFDGWGSYPQELLDCDVYQNIFKTAKKYFEIFQIRSLKNQTLLTKDRTHFSFALKFRNYHILGLDNRTQRSIYQVMGNDQWKDLNTYLDENILNDNLLVLSAVPVVYRDFSLTENLVDFTSWQEELTDDLKDHWRAKEHQGERMRLIMRLFMNIEKRKVSKRNTRTVILSGDVHVGSLGVINDHKNQNKIHQVVSSGIVHTPPTYIEWLGITAVTNDNNEYLNEDKTIETSMLTPIGSAKYLRVRNFVTLNEGSDEKLWINWICDNKDRPCYALN
ncbi:alkaline phosphatase family protein [Arcobacter acticola]|jgi:phosphodiesterase/alkaline phosphatase D-like protein|uniref:Alkaline phosphatase family protein n=1 Tax=Arcobacter acticola TaxID=1849015 RepID=A0A6M8EGT1_9BACT|nr:alkaline phosphatase D family protein [Arcobacter acticola]QKE28646.1 alkaline phosphatase family protein [Arcobacter acticola]